MFTPHATIAGDGYNLLHVAMGSQTGTHVDAPRHIRDDGDSVDRISPTAFVGRGVVLDVRGRVGPGELIGPGLWDGAELCSGDIALVHTGWSAHFGTDEYFRHPALNADGCRWLLDRGVRTVGIDAPSIDPRATRSSPRTT